MAEYLVGPAMDKLINACSEYLKDQVGWKTEVEEELKKLRFIRPQIQAVVSGYSQVEKKDPALNEWYWQLRDAIDEADDVLDDFEYWKLEKQVISENKGKRKAEVPVWNIYENVKRGLRIGKPAPKSDPNLKRLEEAVQKLSEISAQVSTFLHILDRANQKQEQQQVELHEARETGSTPANLLVGRSEEMDFVNKWLRNLYETQNSTDPADLYRNISLLSVVGLGGMGKTTLLQHVYKDATLNKDGATEGFDVKMWASVSHKFDARTVIKNILESLIKERPNLDTLEALQSRLESEVASKRFLLVLDDIWEEHDSKWENVLAPLQYGSSGSKIFITTRMDSVASKIPMIENKEILHLKGLEENDCFLLFKTHAFGIGKNTNIHQNLISMAGDIVKKLSGCPLAAKIIGSSLKFKHDMSYWRKVNNDIENGGLKGLLPILKLSYTYLSDFLQICFAFCSIFPEDHEFDKDDLVRMWISSGFIQSPNNSRETIEETARSYFDMLVEKSFFDEFHNNSAKAHYKMHDLLHELAQSVSAQECFRIVDDGSFSIPKTTRHLSINSNSSSLEAALKKMGEFKNLRSLFLSFSPSAEYDENVLSEILKASKNIRLLAINLPSYHCNMPEKIGCLIHLRYLKVKCYRHFKLPRSISHLYHLQFIISERLPNFEIDNIGWKKLLPNENCQLVLDELVIKDPSAAQLIMEPLKSISSFRSLTIEENDELNSFSTETEQWFVKHSSSLFRLVFYKLQSLQSLPSSLECLSSLDTLRVYNVPQLKLLPNPPASLKKLDLYNLKSLQCLPSSLLTISSLRDIHLNELENLDCLPSCLPTLLRILAIYKVPRLLELPDLPSSLEVLKLERLKSLKCLPSSLSAISSLETLKLTNIPLLKSLPDLPSSLDKLYLEELESLQCLSSSLSTISSLETLKLTNIPLLQSLPDLPSSLERLELEILKSLECLPSLSNISSLTKLQLINIPLLKSLPDLPSSLEILNLVQLENLDCLAPWLPTTLKKLWINKVPRLLELPDRPASLQYLFIDNCDPQLSARGG